MHLVVGRDKTEVQRVLDSLLKTCSLPSLSFYPENFTITAFSQEVETLPFLTGKRAVILYNIDQLSEEGLEAIFRYLKKPSSWIVLYLTASELSAKNKIVQLIEQQGKVERLKEEKPWEKEKRLIQWLIEEAKQEQVRLHIQAATALVQGVDHEMLRAELDKLICFAAQRKEITLEDVSQLTLTTAHETLWQLGDALFACDTKRALEIGTSLMEEEVAIFLSLANLRSQFLTGIEILNAAERGEVAKQFPYLKGKLLENKLQLLRRYGKERLQQGSLLIFETEIKAKNCATPPLLLLQLLILKLNTLGNHDFVSSPQLAWGTY